MFIPFLLLGALALVGYRYRRVLLRRRLRFSWESEALNSFHDVLVARFTSKGFAYQFTRTFYDLGAFLGVAGVAISTGILACETISLLKAAQQSAPPSVLSKRELKEYLAAPEGGETLLKPLIPGVTIPLSEFPLLIIALLASQAFHELGHIVSSALPPAPASLSGVGLALQGAFVSLLPHPDDAEYPWARVRNASAGAWHNVLMWLVLWAACHIGLHTAVRGAFWRDVLPDGLAIISVDYASPLRGHLELGALIVALDDAQLHSLASWKDYLLAPTPHPPVDSGWCVESATFSSQPTDCALHPGTALFTPYPLPSFSDPSQNHCIDPPSVFRDPAAARCASSPSCRSPSETCVAPAADTQLLRLQIKEADHGHTIVWKGPWREVFEQVRVGQYVPRVPLMPVWALPTLEAFFEYLRSLTLVLALLNLLPLRPLDGGVVLSSLLDIVCVPSGQEFDDIELGELELFRRRTARRSRGLVGADSTLIARWVHNVVAMLSLFVIACSLWVWTVRGP
ncbi:hypothetical protein AURDEDRAFT_169972 [Auricularia subglabra TFB-10046 SS5]|uniref:Endopeptidase S2P n=1 Tax=Auricularia subglabra (strain TFB-10046 / SS5) TaxID=717982 RepID=J0D2K4_AURST|nr:hypothetical protein AURDEDRAFT_169972 [Auricularia subglabra TFB-10046 SS5]